MSDPATALTAELVAQIKQQGPMSLEAYMGACLRSYYAETPVFGQQGDFITAPEISQIFGELLGLWAVVAWQAMGSPERVLLVEAGPGRGTLMADALRALAPVPAFAQAAQVHLVETSPSLRQKQAAVLADAVEAGRVTWQDRLEDLPRDAPILLLANEFLDALPIRQFQRLEAGWAERLVGLTEDGAGFCWRLGPVVPDGPEGVAEAVIAQAKPGDFVETCPQARQAVRHLAARIAAQGGAALFIDYGPGHSAPGDSFQAVQGHRFVDPFAAPGSADLTAHVDFETLARLARSEGVVVDGPVQQGVFLLRLGIEARGGQLISQATEKQADQVRNAVRRLIDPDKMGILFKVMALRHPSMPGLPGF
ncbi:MAG: class I SAM-dependent methyltransferase [Rhodospirillaceae bacterium]